TGTGEPDASLNPPAPFPSNTETSLEPWFATARSGLPSRFRSAAATETGARSTPMGEPEAAENPPAPSPRRIETSFEPLLATARSGLPSQSTSATVTELGADPAAAGEPAAELNAPTPFPSSTETLSEPRFATTRSSLPSRFRSATATERG